MQASYEPADIAQVTAELASVFRSAVDRAGLAFEVDCPPLPDPVYLDREHVGEGGAEPAQQRAEVHLRRRHPRRRAAPRAARRSSPWPTPASASPPARCPGCSSGSTASRTPARVRTRAAASGWRWSRSSSSCTAAPSPRQAPRARAPRSPSGCRSGTPTCPPTPSSRPVTRRRCRPPPTPSSRRRCAGCPGPCRTMTMQPTPGPLPEETAPGDGGLPRAGAAAREPPARVLVADDNADMREYLARLLRTAGYHVTMVTDGQAALAAVRVGLPDLVISDVMMPRLDGLGLVAAVRADARTAGAAGAAAVGSGRAGGVRRGPPRGRRRLPGQAVLGGGAARPGPVQSGDGQVQEPRVAVPPDPGRLPAGRVLRHR